MLFAAPPMATATNLSAHMPSEEFITCYEINSWVFHSESVVPDSEYQPSPRMLPLQHYLRSLLLSTESKQRTKQFMTTQFPSFDCQSGLESLKAWFSVLNEMEQTTTLCVLAQQSGISQLLGLIDTVAAMLELEKAKLAGARPRLSTGMRGYLIDKKVLCFS